MKEEVVLIESGPQGNPYYVYREWNGRWVFWRKFTERADAEGCLSERQLMPCREMYVGEEFIVELAG